MSGKSKGSAFEREISKELSLWWTEGKRDDVFWRSISSGAFGTQHTKAGNKKHNVFGDIAYTDSIGKNLLKVCTIEIKTGYSGVSLQDILDKPDKKLSLLKWIVQANKDKEGAKVPYFMLIFKRQRGETLVLFPSEMNSALSTGKPIGSSVDYLFVVKDGNDYFVMRMKEFLRLFTKADFDFYVKNIKDKKLPKA